MEYISGDKCCDDCTDEMKCGSVLKELSDIQGSLMFDHCECVGENTNKALVLYFQSILNQDIELPIFVNSKNQIMDGHHRIQAYNLLNRTQIPIYRNKLWRNHGFCWKNGLEGKRRLRLKTW